MGALQDFIRHYPTKHFVPGEVILMQDTAPESVYFIKSGYVKGYDINSEGVQQLVWLGSGSDYFSEIWLFKLTEKAALFYEALSKVEVYCVDRADLLRFIQNDSNASLEMLRHMAARSFDTLRQLKAVEKPKADQKIAHALLFLSTKFGRVRLGKKIELTIPLTQQDIANLLGLTRETVATELKRLKDLKILHYDRFGYVIHRDKIIQLLAT